jgi:ATP-binding cassette subfamily C protein
MAIGQWPMVVRARNGWRSLKEELANIPDAPAKMHRGKPTISGVSFTLKPGEVLGVIGKSGSGKSTLARALVGIWPPAAGEIRLDAETLQNYDPELFGQYIGYLPQSVSLFHGTVAENVARMAESPDPEMVKKAVAMAHADQLVKSLPESFDTVIHNGTGRLSGGQKQRLGLARAIYGDPALLILDEPNAALDADGSQALNATVRRFKNDGKAIIIMTHRPAAISECDYILYLEGGRQQAYGPRDEVLSSIVKNAKSVAKTINQSKIS